MGIININSYTTPQGDTATGTYIAISKNPIHIQRDKTNSANFIVTSYFDIWKNKASKNANKATYSRINIKKTYTSSELSTGIYTLLYTHIKTIYTNYTDDL